MRLLLVITGKNNAEIFNLDYIFYDHEIITIYEPVKKCHFFAEINVRYIVGQKPNT